MHSAVADSGRIPLPRENFGAIRAFIAARRQDGSLPSRQPLDPAAYRSKAETTYNAFRARHLDEDGTFWGKRNHREDSFLVPCFGAVWAGLMGEREIPLKTLGPKSGFGDYLSSWYPRDDKVTYTFRLTICHSALLACAAGPSEYEAKGAVDKLITKNEVKGELWAFEREVREFGYDLEFNLLLGMVKCLFYGRDAGARHLAAIEAEFPKRRRIYDERNPEAAALLALVGRQKQAHELLEQAAHIEQITTEERFPRFHGERIDPIIGIASALLGGYTFPPNESVNKPAEPKGIG